MIQIKDKDLKQAVEKAVLVLGHDAKTTDLINNIHKELTQLFNKNNIEVLIEKHEVKSTIGKPQYLEQRVASLEQMVYNLNKTLK